MAYTTKAHMTQLDEMLASLERAQSALYTSGNEERLDDIARLQKLYQGLKMGIVRVF